MKFVVAAIDEEWEILTKDTADIQWIRAELPFSFSAYPDADAFFILNIPENIEYTITSKPVFINSVTATLKELQAPENVVRINGWNSFLNRATWEIAGKITTDVNIILQQIHRKAIAVADEPGLIAATVISMIINEAYFALEDNVSSKTEIDTAMQLGTNYPFGPFEWAKIIGLKNIIVLLQKLYINNNRYRPAELLLSESLKS
jgi:3-hydroxybutyryl-CoA dehydrogenase